MRTWSLGCVLWKPIPRLVSQASYPGTQWLFRGRRETVRGLGSQRPFVSHYRTQPSFPSL